MITTIGYITVGFVCLILILLLLFFGSFGIWLLWDKIKDYKEQKKIWNGGWNELTGERWCWSGTYRNYVKYVDKHNNTCVITFRSIDKYKYSNRS